MTTFYSHVPIILESGSPTSWNPQSLYKTSLLFIYISCELDCYPSVPVSSKSFCLLPSYYLLTILHGVITITPIITTRIQTRILQSAQCELSDQANMILVISTIRTQGSTPYELSDQQNRKLVISTILTRWSA